MTVPRIHAFTLHHISDDIRTKINELTLSATETQRWDLHPHCYKALVLAQCNAQAKWSTGKSDTRIYFIM
jgi:hypothetical protein